MSRLFARPGKAGLTLILLAGLSGCSQPPAPKPVHADKDIVASIRTAGENADSDIHINPLRSPHVDALAGKAGQRASDGDYAAAADLLDQALEQAPDAPDLLQKRAELAVRLDQHHQAEKLARRSWRNGPQLGSLCARNWQTVIEMRRLADDQGGMRAARKRLHECDGD